MARPHPWTKRDHRAETRHATRQPAQPAAPDAASRWLRNFPAETHATIRNWFRYVAGKGSKDPDVILAAVTTLIGQKLDWATTPESRQLCTNVLTALRCDIDGARSYAEAMLTHKETHDEVTQP